MRDSCSTRTGETEKQDSGMNVTLTEYQVAEVLVSGHEQATARKAENHFVRYRR